MDLFDFFKRREKEKFDVNNRSLNEILARGILFEDNSKFLKWGTPVKDLAKEVEVKEKLFADRCVYDWGEHVILDGLSLPLTTVYWNRREDSAYKLLKKVTFSVSGNEEAKKYLELIKSHLNGKFGEAKSDEVTDTEVILEWIVSGTMLQLHFFEQFTNKLRFEISRLL